MSGYAWAAWVCREMVRVGMIRAFEGHVRACRGMQVVCRGTEGQGEGLPMFPTAVLLIETLETWTQCLEDTYMAKHNGKCNK